VPDGLQPVPERLSAVPERIRVVPNAFLVYISRGFLVPARERSNPNLPRMASARHSPHPYSQPGRPLAFAHRGGALMAPENTLEAFTRARDLGVDAIELDIWPTADGEAVVFHDDALNRTTDGYGFINHQTLVQLKKLDAGFRFTADGGQTFPFRGLGIRIPTLEQVLGSLPRMRVNVEFKGTRGGFEKRVREIVRAHGAEDRVLACSGEGWINNRVRTRIPEVAHGASPREVFEFWLAVRLGWSRGVSLPVHCLQIPPVHHGLRVVSRELVDAAHESGMAVHVWTIDDECQMRSLLAMGVDGVMSDRPESLLRVMREHAGTKPPDRTQPGSTPEHGMV